jgi:PTH1 family peptidyl-tRNA hydrolase
MKVIAGLGNPGQEYSQTKHNVGFMFIDALAERLHIDTMWKDKFEAKIAEGHIDGEKVILVKPQTYMNDSGRAIGPLLHWYKLETKDLIVAHDDMDIAAGTLRIRRKGSAGGHNGIKSILANVEDENFARVRIGIGRPMPGWTVVNHVLAKFSDEDVPKIKEVINYLLPAVECMTTAGIDLAMNRFNPKKAKKEKVKTEVQTEKDAATKQQEETQV